jgi:hypothetical protein
VALCRRVWTCYGILPGCTEVLQAEVLQAAVLQAALRYCAVNTLDVFSTSRADLHLNVEFKSALIWLLVAMA